MPLVGEKFPKAREIFDDVQDFVRELLSTETLEEYYKKAKKYAGRAISAIEAKLLEAHRMALAASECAREHGPDVKEIYRCIISKKERI